MVSQFLDESAVLPSPYQERIEVSRGGDTGTVFSPLKVFEYMRTGKPIVASDLPRIRDILTDRVSALLCSPDDSKAWCLALVEILENPEFAENLGRRARADFEANYSMKTRASKVLKD
jgi:glycosyltransferase involved in cell wall biosynthesis